MKTPIVGVRMQKGIDGEYRVASTIHEVLHRFSAEIAPMARSEGDGSNTIPLDTSLIQNGLSQGHGFLPASLSANTITSFSVSRNSSPFIGFVR